MKKRTFARNACVAGSLLVAVTLSAEEIISDQQVVVTATRLETPIQEVGSSISVITAQDLERTQTRSVLDALRMVPGVTVSRNGGVGQPGFISVRGGANGFVQVMIDGVKVNDPAGIGTLYDFGNLHADNIERIEVLRGPQSTLYGSDAMSGVINIITRKGEGAPRSFVEVEGGSFNTWRVAAGSRGQIEAFDYSVTLSRFDTDGISAFSKDDGFSERDGYRNNTLSARFGWQATEDARVNLITRYSDSTVNYDTFDGFFMPTEEGKIEKDELFVRGEVELTLMDGLWDQKVGVGHARIRRDYVDAPGVEDSYFNGDITTADWQHNLHWHEMNTLTLGIDYERSQANTSGSSTEDTYSYGLFVQDQITIDDTWFTTLGLRWDDNDAFGSETTYRIASAYHLNAIGTKLKGSYGTGFKAPSLYELYASDFFTTGNPDLDAQTSRGWDVGVEQSLLDDWATIGLTYFEISYDDLIAWVPSADPFAPGTFENINKAKSKGIEAFVASRLSSVLAFRVDYTYLDNTDRSSGNSFELKRPSDQIGARLDITPTDRLVVTLFGQYVGSRTDFGDVRLDSYTLVHLASSFQVSDNLTVFGRIENLFDEDYVEADGYGTPGIAAYAGLRASF